MNRLKIRWVISIRRSGLCFIYNYWPGRKIDALNEQVYLLQEQLQADVGSIKALVTEQKQLMEADMTKYAFEANKKIDAKADKIQII